MLSCAILLFYEVASAAGPGTLGLRPKGDIVHTHAPKSPPPPLTVCSPALRLSGSFGTFYASSKQETRSGAHTSPRHYPATERMDSAAVLLLLTVTAGTLLHVLGTESVTALYGETIVVPCNDGAPAPEDLIFVKWKYEKDDGTPEYLLTQWALTNEVRVQATDQYAPRVSIDHKLSLRITQASLRDQKTFTCIVMSDSNILEYPVTVSVCKEPSSVQIMDRSAALQKDRATAVGTCVAADANPAATITWNKNGKPLVADGKTVLITPSMKLDPASGLATTSSTLQYAASKEDNVSVFSCMSTHQLTNQEAELEPFPIHYPSEKVSLQVLSKTPVVEGDNVTLKCHADGNPPPSSFFFHMKGQKALVENSDTYTLTSISREAGGEYKCSLADNEKMESSQTIVVSYLDLSLTPSGTVRKAIEDSFSVKVEQSYNMSKPIVGVVAGLLIAAAVVGLVYWLYMKNSRQGREREVGTSEESKKLKENHPPPHPHRSPVCTEAAQLLFFSVPGECSMFCDVFFAQFFLQDFDCLFLKGLRFLRLYLTLRFMLMALFLCG